MEERNTMGTVARDEEEFKKALIEALSKSYNNPVDLAYVDANSWDTVAKDWNKRVLK
jgi:hypothetical protein